MTVRMPRSSGSETASNPISNVTPFSRCDAMLLAAAQTVEELVGRQA